MSPPVTEPERPEMRPEMDDKPPVLGSWRNIYALVIGTLVVIIVLGALVTRAYA
jgi:hypothetical protein